MKTLIISGITMGVTLLLSSCAGTTDTQKSVNPASSHISTGVMVTDTSTGNMMTPQSSSGSR